MNRNLDAQAAELKAVGCTEILTESGDGSSLEGRPELGRISDSIRPGETPVVMRTDRSARAPRGLQVIVANVKENGARLAATEQPVETSTVAGKAYFDMLGVFAAYEMNLRRERQTEGIAAARQRGAYRGRRRKIGMDAISDLPADCPSPTGVARDLGISRGTVYKAKDTSGEHGNAGSDPRVDFCGILLQ